MASTIVSTETQIGADDSHRKQQTLGDLTWDFEAPSHDLIKIPRSSQVVLEPNPPPLIYRILPTSPKATLVVMLC